jgi:hypothetical protein
MSWTHQEVPRARAEERYKKRRRVDHVNAAKASHPLARASVGRRIGPPVGAGSAGTNGQILGERPIEAISIFVIHKQAVAVVRIDAGEMGNDLRDVNICACALRHRTRRDSGGWSGGCEIYIRTSCRYSAGNLRHGAGGDACRLNAERALGVVPNELVRVVVKAPLAFGGAEIEGLGGILGEELRVRFVHFRTANVILGHASNIT